LLYKGARQSPSDVINPESRVFARLQFPTDYGADITPLRCVSVSSDTRYVSLAAKVGFAHLSTVTGRWRTLDLLHGITSDDTSVLESIPHIKGGMYWYGSLLIIGADFGPNHEVRKSI